jgi:hypothetical protein
MRYTNEFFGVLGRLALIAWRLRNVVRAIEANSKQHMRIARRMLTGPERNSEQSSDSWIASDVPLQIQARAIPLSEIWNIDRCIRTSADLNLFHIAEEGHGAGGLSSSECEGLVKFTYVLTMSRMIHAKPGAPTATSTTRLFPKTAYVLVVQTTCCYIRGTSEYIIIWTLTDYRRPPQHAECTTNHIRIIATARDNIKHDHQVNNAVRHTARRTSDSVLICQNNNRKLTLMLLNLPKILSR